MKSRFNPCHLWSHWTMMISFAVSQEGRLHLLRNRISQSGVLRKRSTSSHLFNRTVFCPPLKKNHMQRKWAHLNLSVSTQSDKRLLSNCMPLMSHPLFRIRQFLFLLRRQLLLRLSCHHQSWQRHRMKSNRQVVRSSRQSSYFRTNFRQQCPSQF